MLRVAVAGGFGDLGRLIAKAVADTGKHELYIFSRKLQQATSSDIEDIGISPEKVKEVLQTDYASEDQLIELLDKHEIHTVISALNMSSDAVSNSQLKLINASISAASVRRFVPSEYNVDYAIPDDMLNYPAKYYHRASRQVLENQSKLEFVYFYFGSFMDYIGMPRIKSHLKPLYLVFDLESGEVAIPGSGQHVMVTTRTEDGARYVAAALGIPEGLWPKAFAIAGSEYTPLEIAALAEKVMEKKLKIRHDSEKELFGRTAPLLPSSAADTVRGGGEDLKNLLCNLASGIATGVFDIKKADGAVDLVEMLGDQVPRPMSIEEFLQLYWNPSSLGST